ncbi:MAG TPA: L,D-transpeptidase family protein [Longimicrobiaceae bacterium]|jgi:lipoprotein-anchoring transpeptidase ErfK/SrfK|nr:L,D-transpeptidase family protein [Longimicrobiaceae bacterium]
MQFPAKPLLRASAVLALSAIAHACTPKPAATPAPSPADSAAAAVSPPVSSGQAGVVRRDTVPRDVISRDTMRRDTVPRDTAKPRGLVPRDSVRRVGVVRRDTIPRDTVPPVEAWGQIAPAAVNGAVQHLPVGRGLAGPSVVRVQILLDRALFSPGMMDGKWGRNLEHAVFWFQTREGLPATGRVDSTTLERLRHRAGSPRVLVEEHVLTAEEASGPFVPTPENIYEQARLDCSCYQSLAEKLSERFHLTQELLRQLNPGVAINRLAAGAKLFLPAVRNPAAQAGGVARLEISGSGNYVHALDAAGRILYHFPSTLGASYDPSPLGDFRVMSIDPDPWWHYQPALLARVPDSRPDAMIPPGPNSAVGRMWMGLSAPHYGIHGTKSPETIGYAQSAGCVRLTNWDAVFLSARIRPGTPVRFLDTRRATSAVRPKAPPVRPGAAPASAVARSVSPSAARPAPLRAAFPPRPSVAPVPTSAPRSTPQRVVPALGSPRPAARNPAAATPPPPPPTRP